MKISRNWLQKYFERPLPSVEKISDVLTFHAFEIEKTDGDMLDVKVLPNRAADCLCHRGVAKELSAVLDIPLKNDPLREFARGSTSLHEVEPRAGVTVEIEDSKKCLRYMGALVRGVKIGPSPDWLRKALEAVGQRPINNVVDATNYVMLDIGQPLHAFDAAKLESKNGNYAITVRVVAHAEPVVLLGEEEKHLLSEGTLVIADAYNRTVLGIAGVKGGKAAEITETTVDIVIESANFDGTLVRRAAQALKLVTEASLRFQNRPSPELCVYGMRDVLTLIKEIAGGEVAGVVDEYPAHQNQTREISVSLQKINGILGSNFSKEEVENVFKRLGLETKIEGEIFTVIPPFERTDLNIPEDLIEEVGRIIGYDKIISAELPQIAGEPNQERYRGIEKVKDFLVERGFTEISTQSFAKKGDIYLANPLDKTKPALRKSLDENMKEALERAKYNAPLVLAPNEKPKLFEIGTVFAKDSEQLAVETSEPVSDMLQVQDAPEYLPKQCHLGSYKPFSVYPFIVRDIAFWMPSGTEAVVVEKIICENAGELFARLDQFDRFEKAGKTSLAFRLVFQSFDKTLTDDEANVIMQKITAALTAKGCKIR